MKTVAVVGASGLVGSYLYNAIGFNRRFNVVGTQNSQEQDLYQLDMRDRDGVDAFLYNYRPNIVLIPASDPNVEQCQVDETTYELNVWDTLYLADRVLNNGGRVVFFSSSYVFDGMKEELYTVSDIPNPLNMYGQQKLKVETELLKKYNSTVVRTVGVFGKEERQKNFAYQVVNALSTGRKVYVPYDQFMNPIHAAYLAKGVVSLLEMEEHGLFHLAGNDCVSKFEFAQMIAREFNLNYNDVVGVSSEDMKQKAKRPTNACLYNSLLVDGSLKKHIERFTYEHG